MYGMWEEPGMLCRRPFPMEDFWPLLVTRSLYQRRLSMCESMNVLKSRVVKSSGTYSSNKLYQLIDFLMLETDLTQEQ